MTDSIFTKIIKGEIPCYKIYEDQLTFAFLDIHPKVAGHVLVVPKKQIDYVWNLDDTDYLALMKTSRKVAKRIQQVINPRWVAMQIEGVGVPHAHVHIFPFNNVEEYRSLPDQNAEPDHQALAETAKKLAF